MDKWDLLYIDIAERVGQMSYAVRSKVGAGLVKDRNILAFGYNGTPTGRDNTCEDEEHAYHKPHIDHFHYIERGFKWDDLNERYTKLTTKQEVLHAESNAIAKIARSTQSALGSTLYVTLSPCMECAKLIVQCGIEKVVFKEKYRDESSIIFLEENNIEVKQIA